MHLNVVGHVAEHEWAEIVDSLLEELALLLERSGRTRGEIARWAEIAKAANITAD